MAEYQAPLRDMQFVLRELVDLEALSALPGFEEFNAELAEAVLEEAGKLAGEVLSPINRSGDLQGVKWTEDGVKTAPGWIEAYRQFVEGGWNGLSGPAEYEGQNLPRVISALVEEMWNGANISFALCPMLTRGAIEALELRGSEEQKTTYLPKLVSGEWTGTMNLTEPQAGSDLAAVRCRAVPQDDGSYKLDGQKIFITYGDHDLTDNIIHMVLARRPDAPEGVKGISMFLVPKFLVNEDGTPGKRNPVRCVSVEHKLGIHASPTCVIGFEGATGYLVGEENRGIEYMFIMMNAARYSVGIEGIGLSERAYQRAAAYARERVQGTEAGVRGGGKVAIIRHPDIRRMLMLMRSQTEAMRALAAVVAVALDTARLHPDADERARQQAFVDLMIPVVKGWSTENGIDITSLGVQIHGGMGFIEETGAAQHFRDSRITTIYEGTTGIQANDLMGRKIARDGGAAAAGVLASMRELVHELAAVRKEPLQSIGEALNEAVDALETAVEHVVANYREKLPQTLVGAVPLLKLFGIVAGGWQMGRAALTAQKRLASASEGEAGFLNAKIVTAQFYAEHVLAQAAGLSRTVVHGADGALALADDQF